MPEKIFKKAFSIKLNIKDKMEIGKMISNLGESVKKYPNSMDSNIHESTNEIINHIENMLISDEIDIPF